MTQLEKFRVENAELQDKLRQTRQSLENTTRALHNAQADNAELRRLTAESVAHKAHADWLQKLTETLVNRVSVEALTRPEPSFSKFTMPVGYSAQDIKESCTCGECGEFLPHHNHKPTCSRR